MTSFIFWSKVIAWAATVLCVFASARAATVFAKNSTRSLYNFGIVFTQLGNPRPILQ